MAFSSLPFRGSARIRSRPYAGQVVALQVVTRDIDRIPVGLKRAYQKMLRELQIALVANYKAQVPGAANGRLGRHVAAKRLKRGVVVGVFGTEFARSLNYGFTSIAKNRKALKITLDGGDVIFRKRVKVAGRHYHERAILTSGPIV